MDRIILHIDANCFFASVETAYNPNLAGFPVAVTGDAQARHGIILTANYIAKRTFGIKTGETIISAKSKCPKLITIKSNPKKYLRHSSLLRQILSDYSNNVEPFGCDEAWVYITDIAKDFKTAKEIAEEISLRVKRELHITVSIGVSFCKVFAKFGSDYKKPDAITVITPDNYRKIVWPCDCSQLIYVGPATKAKLKARGVFTIGDIARTPPERLKTWLGKNGLLIHSFATGDDLSLVRRTYSKPPPKSIGNSTTANRDLVCIDDVKRIFFVLADSVARRLREKSLCANKISIWLRRCDLSSFTHGAVLRADTDVAFEIADTAMRLFCECYDLSTDKPLRSIGITASDISAYTPNPQISLFADDFVRTRRRALELAMDSIRSQYGYYSICRASLLADKSLTHFDPKSENVLHPVGDFNAVRPSS